MIDAKILAHTKNSYTGDELVTFQCTYHRFILPEVNTYRMLSKNSGSSRAIPVKTRIESILTDPAGPVEWGENCKGMVAQNLLDGEKTEQAKIIWMEACQYAIECAKKLSELGVHKQIVNRLLEPFSWQTSVITGNREWFEHMFAQRIHKDAQPEFRELCKKMKEVLDNSVPKLDVPHQPYITDKEVENEQGLYYLLARYSVARCARVSYTPFDSNRPDWEKDMALYYRLLYSDPPHMSPFEHYAFPYKHNTNAEDIGQKGEVQRGDVKEKKFNNLKGFVNLRYIIEHTQCEDPDQEIEDIDENLENGFVTEKLLERLKP